MHRSGMGQGGDTRGQSLFLCCFQPVSVHTPHPTDTSTGKAGAPALNPNNLGTWNTPSPLWCSCSFISLSREASTSQEFPAADSTAPPDANLHVPGLPQWGRASDLSLCLHHAPGNPVLLLGEPKSHLQGTDSFSRACFKLHLPPRTEKPSATGQHSL